MLHALSSMPFRLAEWAGAWTGRTQGTNPGVFFQDFGLQVDSQKVGYGYHPGQDIGHFFPHVILSPPVGPGKFPDFLQEPEEGLVRSPLLVPVQVDLTDEILEFSDFQGLFPPPAGSENDYSLPRPRR
jgi:hypothetical protein